jgi:hypothetical protein
MSTLATYNLEWEDIKEETKPDVAKTVVAKPEENKIKIDYSPYPKDYPLIPKVGIMFL